MSKILLSVCGIGLGHATRTHAILKLLDRYNVKVLAAQPAHKYFKDQKIDSTEISGIEYGGKEFSFSIIASVLKSIKKSFSLRREYKIISNIIEDFKPNVILSDSEPLSILAGKNKKRLIITNFPNVLSETKVIPKNIMNRTLSLQYSLIKRLIHSWKNNSDKILSPTFVNYEKMEGVRFVNPIIRDYSKKVSEKNFYLVNFGGSEFYKEIFYDIINALKRFKDKKFIMTSNNLTNRIKILKNITVYPFIKDMPFYIKSCKGMILHGGHSNLSEAVVNKKPCLVMPIKNHIEQLSNAHSLHRKDLAEVSYEKMSEGSLARAMTKFFSKEDEIRKSLKNVEIKGDGAKQVVSEIKKYLD
jgi:uncharacterized protein (TIGR00661 family)